MRAGRGRGRVVASPVLIGAVTTLVVLVAVLLAYNANNGLPFVPTRELKVDFRSGQELVKGDEVREGGYRIGVVRQLRPVRLPGGAVGAEAVLRLDRSVGAFPVDTVATIRPRSSLGLQYLELERGRSRRMLPAGGTLAVGHTRTEIELDDVLSTFDAPTRSAEQRNLVAFGDAFAGRGGDLNEAISGLPAALGSLRSVAANLVAPRTGLSNFFRQLDVTAGVLAPISGVFAHLFTTMADTFAAIDRDPAALRAAIAEGPGTLSVGTGSLRVQRPFLDDLAALGVDLTPAFRSLRDALPTVNVALRTGTRVTARSGVLYGNLQDAMRALRGLAVAPSTNAALRGLTATVGTLQPQLRFLGPVVTVCNNWDYWWTLVGEAQTSPTPEGFALRALGNNGNAGQPDDVGSEPANIPAHGGTGLGGVPTVLHGSGALYGNAVDDAGQADCSWGQLGYVKRSLPPNVPAPYGNLDSAVTPQLPIPYREGSTFARYGPGGRGVGRAADHVPAGETFTAQPGGLAAQIDGPVSHDQPVPALSPDFTP